MIEDAQLLPWLLGGVSTIINALFVAYVVQVRGRLRDLKENRDEWRRLYLDCDKREDARESD